MTRRAALLWTVLARVRPAYSALSAIPVIVDTDAGSDDLLAIAFLLSRTDVQIEAISVSNGLAHIEPGASNLCRLLSLAGKPDIPVYRGFAQPSQGNRAFPGEWRLASDDLAGVRLPTPKRKPESQHAVEFLARRLSEPSRPVRLLALGPLTNVAAAMQHTPKLPALEHLIIMGGALHVPGNLGDGGAFQTDNKVAEWNIFVDPRAASVVFGSGARITLIPLDATAKVPIDLAFFKEFQQRARTPLGIFAGEVLKSDLPHIQGGYFQAWDPLAAVALVEPRVVTSKRMSIAVLQTPPQEGRTVEVQGGDANVAVALDANAAEFKRVFLRVF